MPRKTITAKQEAFCQEYVVNGGIGIAAYRKAYNSTSERDNTAAVAACKLLNKANIAQRIQSLRDSVPKQTQITVERVKQEYARLAFLDIRKAFNDDGSLKPVKDIDDDTAAAIAGIDVERRSMKIGGQEMSVSTRTSKLKLSDKRAALDSLAKHLGMFTEKVEITGKGGGPVEYKDKSPMETARRLAFLMAQASMEDEESQPTT